MLDRTSMPTIDVDRITQIAANSPLARVSWEDRGRAPIGYIKGMAVMFAVAQQKLAQGHPATLEMAKPATGGNSRDALDHYSSMFAALGMHNDLGGVETLRHLFVLLIGLGMRESSGRYCEGYDREENRDPLTSESAEAGLFQMSWNARSISPFIAPLFDEYKRSGGGFKSIFAEGVTPTSKDLETVGSGEGASFQQTCKERPGLAVETAAIGLRKHGGANGHWGPIRKRKAELRREADDMLRQVQNVAPAIFDVHPETFPRLEPARGILWVQQSLNKLGARPPLDEDGEDGPLTQAVVVQFQQASGLPGSGFADAATIAAIERRLGQSGPAPVPRQPNDIVAWLERLVMLLEKLQGKKIAPTPPISPQTDQLRKAIEFLSAIVSPGGGKSQPLGQVNGALGDTIGQLLNGKKTAIGAGGALLTSILSQVPATSGLGQVLAPLIPAAGLSPFAMPIFLGLSAWGVLGKFEKWSQRTAPPPRVP